MTLQQLAQVGEFLGGLSILITLIYLAMQIRGNTKAVRSAGAQQTHDSMVQAYRQLAGDKELNRVFRIGTNDINSLTKEELGQFFAFWSASLFIAQNWLYQAESGVLEKKLVSTFLLGMSSNFHAEGFKAYWSERKFVYSETLQEWVEDIMAKPPIRANHALLGPKLEN